MNIGLLEVLIIALILLLIFGASRIPEVGRALGSGFRQLREQVSRRSPGGEEIHPGHEPPRPTAEPVEEAEPVEDEEPAKRP